MTKIKELTRRWRRYGVIAAEGVLGSILITGCGSGPSAAVEVHQLIQQYPWLSRLAFAFLEGLATALGWNVGMLLRTAAVALLAA